MSFPMMPGFRDFGDRPGDATSASFLARVNQELAAARRLGVSSPLSINKGPHGDSIALDRGTIDLRRFQVAGTLLEGNHATANAIGYDPATNTCTITGEEFQVHSPGYSTRTPAVVMRDGDFGLAYFQPDAGRWEFLQPDTLNLIDGFFPARLDSHTGTSPILYAWVEVEWTLTNASATDKADGRTGTTSSWTATELNNNSVADDTIVWMRRGFKPSSPADATITKTASGNGAGVHAAFSLYVDANTTTGGTYTITMDGFTTAAIAYDASSATTKSAIQTATGYTLSAFGGAGTFASPWTFTVTSDVLDHSASTNTAALKDKSGFRFDMGAAGSAGLCGWGAMPAAVGTYKVVVKQDSDDCFAYITPASCTSPFDMNGGLTA